MKKIAFIILIISLLSTYLPAQNQHFQPCRTKMDQVINSINQMYVDSVDFDPLVDKAISSMLKELDPHTSYIQKKDVQAMMSCIYTTCTACILTWGFCLSSRMRFPRF